MGEQPNAHAQSGLLGLLANTLPQMLVYMRTYR